MNSEKILCVISHTHWDREWYMPLELMRLRLVDLIDRCLQLLETEPNYVFHLDAQTVVLEDYLSIRTDRRAELETYIREGRLVVGPWYLQNDYYLTSGEATVRNLLEGTRLARSFGNVGTVGYAPDQFGNISQLPQILHGFGIDNFLFGRGACKTEQQPDGSTKRVPFPSEFIWQGADGSRVLAVHMTYWYNNAQRFSADPVKARKLADNIVKSFDGIAATPYLLLMNGVDHLEAQDDLLPILAKMRDGGLNIRQMRMDEYIQHVRESVHKNSTPLTVYSGELRGGADYEMLKGTLSSRIYLKQANVKMQNRMEQELEPLYAMLALSSDRSVYPNQHFRYLWKELMKNHPHDSICGCSRDEVHQHMEDNFLRLEDMSREMLRRGMELASTHMVLRDSNPDNYGILIANTTAETREDVVRVAVDLPVSEKFEGFSLLDAQGSPAEFRVLSRRRTLHDVFSPINLPGSIDVDRYEVELAVAPMKPYSFRAYTVCRSSEPVCVCGETPEADNFCLENAHLKITVNPDGTVDMLHKATGRLMKDCLDWEETADRGDSYVYDGGSCRPIYGHEFPAEVTVTDSHPLHQSITIRRVMRVPGCYDFAKKTRCSKKVNCSLALTITLRGDAKTAELSYGIDNQAKEHRIRLLVQTDILCDKSAADIPFDIVRHTAADHYFKTGSKVLPNTSFAALEASNGGVAVLTTGQHEYEHFGKTLAFTVVRSTGVIFRDAETNEPTGGDQWMCPGNQCLRKLTGRIGLYPFAESLLSCVPQEALRFRTPLETFFFAADPHKFSGGRPGVQDTTIAEYYYLPDPAPAMKLESDKSVLSLKRDNGVMVTALKYAECRGGIILRLLNLGDTPVSAELVTDKLLSQTTLSELSDTPLDTGSITLRNKQLYTLRLGE